MVPKLIHPLPPNEIHTVTSGGELDEEPPTPHPLNETWMQVGVDPSPPFFHFPCKLIMMGRFLVGGVANRQ